MLAFWGLPMRPTLRPTISVKQLRQQLVWSQALMLPKVSTTMSSLWFGECALRECYECTYVVGSNIDHGSYVSGKPASAYWVNDVDSFE